MAAGATTVLPDDALAVRGGENLPGRFLAGTGVVIDAAGKLNNVSVNCAPGRSVRELTGPNPNTGYRGIPNKQVGVTTVGAIRAAGGDVIPSPIPTNPNHATLAGITPDQASQLFRPTTPNPSRTT